MEIRNAGVTPSKSNQLRNVNTVRWECRNITSQPGEIDDRECEVIAFVVNTGMNITANNFYTLNKGKKFLYPKYLSGDLPDSHLTVFTFRSWLDLLDVVLAFWISILKISKLLQNC